MSVVAGRSTRSLERMEHRISRLLAWSILGALPLMGFSCWSVRSFTIIQPVLETEAAATSNAESYDKLRTVVENWAKSRNLARGRCRFPDAHVSACETFLVPSEMCGLLVCSPANAEVQVFRTRSDGKTYLRFEDIGRSSPSPARLEAERTLLPLVTEQMGPHAVIVERHAP